MTDPPVALPAEAPGPRRLDPRTILVRALPGLPSAIFAVPVVLTAVRGGASTVAVVGTILTLILGVIVGVSWLRWSRFTYEVRPDQLLISQGLFQRTRRSIPVERIQDVSINRTLLARLIGLAEVRIETGGGDKDEGRLDSVSLAEAHRLRALLRGLGRGEATESSVETADHDLSEPVLYRLGVARLLYFGVFNFSLLWIAAILAAGQYAGQGLGLDWERWSEVLGLVEREVAARASLGLFLGVTGSVLALGLLAGVGRTILRFYDFRLSFAEGRFRYSRGLLTRAEIVVAQRQIQLGLVERGGLSGRLGWCAFKVQTLGGSDHVSGRQELVPFARPWQIEPLVALAGLPPFEPAGLTRVSGWHTERGLIGFVAVPAVVLVGAALMTPLVGLLGVFLLVPLIVALSRQRCHRYGLAETSLQVTRGVLKQRDWTVPFGNIQSVTLRRGPLQRAMGIASVRIDTAGGSGLNGPHIHDLEAGRARALVAALIECVDRARAGPE
ncbi:PH domain-containing protein [Brevundimonas staleyi]|uniref:PH domain-containing protein n=1 Tax=Brevundimonas staleyi TaxID=74326 RepID=A0ABW0FX86_9CAUL